MPLGKRRTERIGRLDRAIGRVFMDTPGAVPRIGHGRVESRASDERHTEQLGHQIQADLRQDSVISRNVELIPLMDSGLARRHRSHINLAVVGQFRDLTHHGQEGRGLANVVDAANKLPGGQPESRQKLGAFADGGRHRKRFDPNSRLGRLGARYGLRRRVSVLPPRERRHLVADFKALPLLFDQIHVAGNRRAHFRKKRLERSRVGAGGGRLPGIDHEELRQDPGPTAGLEKPFQQNAAARIRHKAEVRLNRRRAGLAALVSGARLQKQSRNGSRRRAQEFRLKLRKNVRVANPAHAIRQQPSIVVAAESGTHHMLIRERAQTPAINTAAVVAWVHCLAGYACKAEFMQNGSHKQKHAQRGHWVS